MRAYYIPASAGALMVVSAFLPWMHVGDVPLGGVPETASLWILGLGALAVLLAGLSIWTRKNSRHPLLLVGLAAFAIMFLGYQWMSRTVRDAAWAQAQASAIVERRARGCGAGGNRWSRHLSRRRWPRSFSCFSVSPSS